MKRISCVDFEENVCEAISSGGRFERANTIVLGNWV